MSDLVEQARLAAKADRIEFEIAQQRRPEADRMAFVGPHLCDALADEIDRLRAELEKADETMIRAAIREKQMADELANHKEAQDDHNRLVRELDVIWNGEAGAAKQASLRDVVSQISREWAAIKGQEPVALIDGNGEQVLFPSDAMYHYWIGRNCTPLYALPVAPAADKDAERSAKYEELLYAVTRKFPNETRHETALRYIQQAENQPVQCGDAMAKGE